MYSNTKYYDPLKKPKYKYKVLKTLCNLACLDGVTFVSVYFIL